MSNTEVWNGSESRSIRSDFGNKRGTSILGLEEKRGITAKTANVLTIDVSLSTEDRIGNGDNRKKIDGIKEATSNYAIKSDSESYLAIVPFSSIARVLCPMQQIGHSKLQFLQAVQKLTPEGKTAMREALELSEAQFRSAPNGFKKRLYLMTDGMNTSGDPSPVAERLKQQDVQLHMIGFGDGDNIDSELLQRMASVSASGSPLYFHFTEARSMTSYFKKQTQTITQ